MARGRGNGHFFRHGELPLVLLALLAERPMHGYDLLLELDRRFGPNYSASAGSVYPALMALADEELVRTNRVGVRKVHELSDAGRTVLRERASMLADIERRSGVSLDSNGGLRRAVTDFAERVLRVEDGLDAEIVSNLLDRTATAIEKMSGTRRRKR